MAVSADGTERAELRAQRMTGAETIEGLASAELASSIGSPAFTVAFGPCTPKTPVFGADSSTLIAGYTGGANPVAVFVLVGRLQDEAFIFSLKVPGSFLLGSSRSVARMLDTFRLLGPQAAPSTGSGGWCYDPHYGLSNCLPLR